MTLEINKQLKVMVELWNKSFVVTQAEVDGDEYIISSELEQEINKLAKLVTKKQKEISRLHARKGYEGRPVLETPSASEIMKMWKYPDGRSRMSLVALAKELRVSRETIRNRLRGRKGKRQTKV